MSIDTIKLLARYNHHVNQELGRVLTTLTAEEWNKPLGGYFPSIRALASHIYSGDLAWLKRFAGLRTFTIAADPVLNRTLTKGEVLFPTFADYDAERKALDKVISHFVEELSPADLDRRLRFKNHQGEDQERNFGGLVLHVFNHQTHHRGQIALYLDLLGKQNDFSGLAPLV
jgi:uncharacterized damage-inducible protein DinB